ncbi:MAG: hypothetical protein IPN77_15410 [Sandaracinaceae bacterium]|nr:hypothetical protein [Sandaracinaceae bacterium]
MALQYSMAVYGVQPGEGFWAASDVGWVVGPQLIVYGPLLNGNTTVLFEGGRCGRPTRALFFRVIAEHGVKKLFCAHRLPRHRRTTRTACC